MYKNDYIDIIIAVMMVVSIKVTVIVTPLMAPDRPSVHTTGVSESDRE